MILPYERAAPSPPDSIATDGGDADAIEATVEDATVEAQGSDAEDPCRAKYGQAPEYVPCGGDEASCAFNAWTGLSSSCADLCAQFFGTCLDAIDNPNDPDQECVDLGSIGCDRTDNQTDICICTR